MAGLQFGHDAAHVLHAGRAQLRLDRLDRGGRFGVAHLGREEAFDDRDLGLFGVGEFLAAAAFVHLDRFAALLDHLLQHLDHHGIVVRRGGAGAQFDVAVLDRRLDQADRGARFLVAGLHGGDLGGLDVVANHGRKPRIRESQGP